MVKITKKSAGNTVAKVLIATVTAVGITKAHEMLSAKGGMAEKVSALSTLLLGAGLQFTESEIAKTVGVVLMGKGGVSSIQSLITSNGAVKSDAISSTLAKAVLPQGAGLSGTRRRGMRGLGNTPTFALPSASAMPMSQTLNVTNLADF
ncbi:hypothetical protein [Roseivirga seohaensis]|uniref:hypothetical protein n=1 Tax=Roseivirga seohaensis TaxID=1914963 RepID=UPI003BAC9B48